MGLVRFFVTPIFDCKIKMRTEPIKVALKKLKNSKNMGAFINEVNYLKLLNNLIYCL